MTQLKFGTHDKLNREKYAEFLKSLIVNSDKYKRSIDSQSFVIALDAPWGSGKSYFVSMLTNDLNESEPINETVTVAIKYNAWENDFWDNAFEPLMQSILDNKEFDRSLNNEKLSKMGINIAKGIYTVAKGIKLAPLRLLIGESQTDKATEHFENACANFKDYVTGEKSVFKELDAFKANISILKAALTEFVYVIASEHNNKLKLVIIIDELDRCKPLFAIQTLEIVKHLFDIENVVFVFALDINQLSHSIKCVYGQGMDSVGYLCRFFDYISKMPKVDLRQYIKVALGCYDGDSLTRWNKMSGTVTDGCEEPLAEFIFDLQEAYGFSMRDIDTFIQIYKIMLDNFLNKYEYLAAHKIYLNALAMKYKRTDLFTNFVSNKPLINEDKISAFVDKHVFLADFKDAFIKTTILKNKKFCLRSRDQGLVYIGGNRKIIVNTNNNIELYQEKSRDNRSPHPYCFDYIITVDDLKNWKDIENLTMAEFIHRKLEMYDFIVENAL